MSNDPGRPNFLIRTYRFYRDGFKTLTPTSRKLFVMFAILRAFFFPNVVKQEAERQHMSRSEFVEQELLQRRAVSPTDTLHGGRTNQSSNHKD